MAWYQKKLRLDSKRRGIHLITGEILSALPEIKQIQIGMLNIFIQHSSASLAINENADPDVRVDLESYLNHNIQENEPYYRHTLEGSDDMPAHIKAVLIGSSLNIPISGGRMAMGTWQGIYLCEHRNHGGSRKILLTLNGE
ncbi:MAG: hypothetical protein CR997_13415 [Acidobacteria bacterium]|nr:MAG: hypothetical protein CR997_13415 [Acidobacteriota bacterium]